MKKLLCGLTAVCMIIVMLVVPMPARAAVPGYWPVQPEFKVITTEFDERRNISDSSGYHNAIDIQADGGSNVYAAYAGVVNYSGWLDAYGYTVVIWHESLGVYTFYTHCSALKCSAGDSVSAGQLIGLVGMTGAATGNHVHFGVCDTVANGWPRKTYYNPLTYFSFTDVDSPVPAGSDTCNCSDEYAGVYTTKNVVSYMNIRSAHNANSTAIGTIPAGAEFIVTMGDGKWAHVSYEGMTGCCNMDYMQKVGDIQPGMSITAPILPYDGLKKGEPFYLGGIISSNLPIAKVWGGVYNAEDESATDQFIEAEINTHICDISVYFDKKISFGSLEDGNYIYMIFAEDSKGNQFEVVRSYFWIGQKDTAADDPAAPEFTKGDLNVDGSVNIGDAVLLQQYLIHKSTLPDFLYEYADMNDTGKVDVFDLILLSSAITGE